MYPQSMDNFILAVASGFGDRELLRINNDLVTKLYLPVQRRLHGVWFDSPHKIYLCGAGIFHKAEGDQQWQEVMDVPLIFTKRIRGNGLNDIWAVGDFGIAVHFNGLTWREFPQFRLSNGNYEGLAVKGNLVLAVGWEGESAVILRINK